MARHNLSPAKYANLALYGTVFDWIRALPFARKESRRRPRKILFRGAAGLSFLCLWSLACRDHPGMGLLRIQLVEKSSILIDGKGGNPRDVGDIVALSDGTFILLDRRSIRLHRVSAEGRILESRRYSPLQSGRIPDLLAVAPSGALLLTSSDGFECDWYSGAFVKLQRECEWGVALTHRQQILGTSVGFLALARENGSRKILHLISEDLSEVLLSGGNATRISNPEDSLVLNWGLGSASLGNSGSVWYASYNPLEINRLDMRLRNRDRWRYPQQMQHFAEFLGRTGQREGFLLDLFERTTALVPTENGLLQVSYFPFEDLTTLRIFDRTGVLRASSTLPFRFDVQSVLKDGSVIATRHLNPRSIGIYSIRSGNETLQ